MPTVFKVSAEDKSCEIETAPWNIRSVDQGVKFAETMNLNVASLPQVIMNSQFMKNYCGFLVVRSEGAPIAKGHHGYAKDNYYLFDRNEGTFTLKKKGELFKVNDIFDLFVGYVENNMQVVVVSRAANGAIKRGNHIIMQIFSGGGLLVEPRIEEGEIAKLALVKSTEQMLRK